MPSAGHKVDSVTVLSPANATKVHESLVWSLTPLYKIKMFALLHVWSALRVPRAILKPSSNARIPFYTSGSVQFEVPQRILKPSSNARILFFTRDLACAWSSSNDPQTILKPSSTARILFFTSDSHQFEVLRLGTYIILKHEVSSLVLPSCTPSHRQRSEF